MEFGRLNPVVLGVSSNDAQDSSKSACVHVPSSLKLG